MDAGLRLLLGGPSEPATSEQVLEFLAYGPRRGLDSANLWIARDEERILWTTLPVVHPGKTMLLIVPSADCDPAAVSMLADTVCLHFRDQGVCLAQVLLEPGHGQLYDAITDCGFAHLAELIYLDRRIRTAAEPKIVPPYSLQQYSTQTHRVFAETILRSYQGSLDCPALNGIREIDDIIAGHQAAGDFEPGNWHLLLRHGQPQGVLLLNRTVQGDALELVYLGLVPEARGKGIGSMFMQIAVAAVPKSSCQRLTLAVDARNAPALKLYHRHGLSRIGSRHALIRDLRDIRPV